MYQRRNGARAASKRHGDVGVGKIGVVAKDQRESLPSRKGEQLVTQLGANELRHPFGDLALVLALDPTTTVVRVAGVDDRPPQIRTRLPNVTPSRVKPYEGVLNEVLCDLFGPRQHESEPNHLRTEFAVALREGCELE
jgi:hypothetical protein